MKLKELIELFGGRFLFGGSLIQFGGDSFKEMYRQIYDAGMLTEREECARLIESHGTTLANGAMLAEQIRARIDHDPTKEHE